MNPSPIHIGTVVAVMLCAGFAHAQEITAGDIKAKGTRMAKNDLEATLKGSTVRYNSSSNGQPTQYVLNADGTYVGTTTTRNGRPSKAGTQGTWQLTDDGKFCRSQETKGQSDDYCWTIWKVSDKYYYIGQGNRVTELDISK